MGNSEIDLHGLTLDEACIEAEREVNHQFIQDEQDRRLVFITGRGGVLQVELRAYLDQHPLVKEVRVDEGVLRITLEDLC